MPLGAAPAWLDAHPHREQGEFVLVIAPAARRESSALDADLVLATLLEALGPSDAARLAARLTGQTRKTLYARAIELGERGKR